MTGSVSESLAGSDLFVYDTLGNESIDWGQATNTMIRDIVPDSEHCNNSNRHSTAHLRDFLTPGAPMAEVGWIRGLFAGGEQTYFFVEVKPFLGEVQGPWFFDAGGALNVYYRFKVTKIDWTTTWRFFVDDDLNGASPTELCPLYPQCGVDSGFENGYPMGETARVGAISAYDVHTNLWSRNNLGQWAPWGGQALEYDEIVGYHWHKNSASQFTIHTPESQHGN